VQRGRSPVVWSTAIAGIATKFSGTPATEMRPNTEAETGQDHDLGRDRGGNHQHGRARHHAEALLHAGLHDANESRERS
jgi:hypothetical protein